MPNTQFPSIDNREEAHSIHPEFDAAFQDVKEHYFSRNSEYWPCFSDSGFSSIINFRKQNIHPSKLVEAYPGGAELQQELFNLNVVPQESTTPNGETDELLQFVAALSKNWENPSAVENVITMPCDPGIYGSMIGILANPNLVYEEYSGMADELEKCVIRQMAKLAGYDEEKATGIFTQGGTFCNLYGYLLGLRKSLPEAKHYGMGFIHDYRFINSHGGHYSNITNLSLLGVDINTRTIRIKLTHNNDIDLDDLEQQLHACFSLKCVIPTIMLTLGTTDTFGLDDVKPVYDLRNRLCEHYEVEVKPHIHVDSAIGWSMLFFLGYDFASNPLRINDDTLHGIESIIDRFHGIRYADSFTIDFQKWGYLPYTSSLVMIKNRNDMKHLESDPDNFSYFENDIQGHTHLQSTIECSRGASGLFGAYNALKYLGIEGYQTVLAHCLQNANYFRYRLQQLGFVKVLAGQNKGPSVGFRLYNPEDISDADSEFDYEYQINDTEEYRTRVDRNSEWHRSCFQQRGKIGLFTNWVGFIAHTSYDDKGRYRKIPGEKAVFMNPVTTRKEIDLFVENICGK